MGVCRLLSLGLTLRAKGHTLYTLPLQVAVAIDHTGSGNVRQTLVEHPRLAQGWVLRCRQSGAIQGGAIDHCPGAQPAGAGGCATTPSASGTTQGRRRACSRSRPQCRAHHYDAGRPGEGARIFVRRFSSSQVQMFSIVKTDVLLNERWDF